MSRIAKLGSQDQIIITNTLYEFLVDHIEDALNRNRKQFEEFKKIYNGKINTNDYLSVLDFVLDKDLDFYYTMIGLIDQENGGGLFDYLKQPIKPYTTHLGVPFQEIRFIVTHGEKLGEILLNKGSINLQYTLSPSSNNIYLCKKINNCVSVWS